MNKLLEQKILKGLVNKIYHKYGKSLNFKYDSKEYTIGGVQRYLDDFIIKYGLHINLDDFFSLVLTYLGYNKLIGFSRYVNSYIDEYDIYEMDYIHEVLYYFYYKNEDNINDDYKIYYNGNLQLYMTKNKRYDTRLDNVSTFVSILIKAIKNF